MNNIITKEEKNRIDLICKRQWIDNYIINEDGTVDVEGDADLEHKRLKQLPLRFGNMTGNFNCFDNDLTSLEGSPTIIGGDFYCSINMLTSLEGSPTSVGGNFRCGYNGLTSLVGAPTAVGGSFYCDENQLTTLEGAPVTIGGDLICSYNKLISTYSGDVDIEISGEGYFDSQCLPVLFVDNIVHIKLILKYQRHFFIWNDDLTLNEENFQELLNEIEDGLM